MRALLWFGSLLLAIPLNACGGSDSNAAPSTANGGSGGTPQATYPKPCSDLYDPAVLPLFEVEMAPDQLALMDADCRNKVKQYRPITFRYGNEVVDAMIRLKGNWSWRCGKMQFVISFNETDPNGRFHGLRKIVLDAPWYDPSLLAERVGMNFMRRQGSYWSCVNNARLNLNGQYYGAYVNAERLDKEYLQRHFPGADADGDLYDGGVTLTTNEGTADVTRRDTLMASTSSLATIAGLVDLEEVVKMWSASAMLPDSDSYWAGVEINYFLYDHPTRGFLWMPYDMDMTLRSGVMNSASSTVDVRVLPELVQADPLLYQHPQWLREPLLETVLSDSVWCNRFLEGLKASRAAYDVTLMSKEIDTWAAQISTAISQDTHKLYSDQDHANSLVVIKQLMVERAQFVDTWLSTATCPVTRWPRN